MGIKCIWSLGLLLLFAGCSSTVSSEAEEGPDLPPPPLKAMQVTVKPSNGERYLLHELNYDRQGRKSEERHYAYDGSGDLDRRTEYHFDEQGREWKHVDYHADGSINFSTEFEFDARDSISGYRSHDQGGNLTFYVKSAFDSLGRCVADTARDLDGSLRFLDIYELDTAGRRLLWDRFEGDSLAHRVVYIHDGEGRLKDMICSGLLGGTYNYEYDAEGRRWKEHLWNTDDGTFLWTKVWEYGEDGRIRRIMEYGEEGKMETPRKVYDYAYEVWY